MYGNLERIYIIAELSMKSLFLGQSLDDNIHPLLIDRIWRRTPKPSNDLMKPIYKLSNVRANIFERISGFRLTVA